MRPASFHSDPRNSVAMAKLDILTFPDPRLRRTALPVARVDGEIQRLVDDMLETMYEAPGIGLAAIQFNVPRRVIVISVPGFFETVKRAERVRVEALDRQGKCFTLDADGLLAVCIQHEIDHLDGKLFVDHISMLKRQRIRRKLEKEQRQGAAKQVADASEQRRSAI